MAGGLLAARRDWFFELGGYDMSMRLYGGEEMELAFRVWQCGGRAEDASGGDVVFEEVLRHVLGHPAGQDWLCKASLERWEVAVFRRRADEVR